MVAHADSFTTPEELAQGTKFISLDSWLDYMKDCAKWFLSHPVFNSNQSPTEETTGETLEPSGEAKFETFISSIGKRRIFYKNAGAYELLEMAIKCNPDSEKMETTLVRTGLGATTRVIFADDNPNFSADIIFGSDNTQYRFSNLSYTASDNTSGSASNFCTQMIAQTVNELPTYESPYNTVLAHTAWQVIGTSSNKAKYAENTFSTNNSTYYSNHVLMSQTNFNICNYMMPIQNNTYVDASNINNYANYGLVVGAGGVVSLDPNIFLSYFDTTLKPELELLYKNTYTHFPDIGADFSDDDIIYVNPFGNDEQEPTGDTSGQIQPFIDYDEILSERELESILAESRYILDTEPYDISLDYGQAVSEPYGVLKQNKELPAEVAGTVSGLYDIALSVIPSEMLSVYGFVAFLSVGMWFILRR